MTIRRGNSIIAGNVADIPSQTGQSGKFLTTNGTAASWADPTNNCVKLAGNQTINDTKIFNTDYTAFKGTSIDILNSSTTLASVGINYEDVNNVVYGQDFIRTQTNGSLVNAKAIKSHSGDNWANLIIGFDANDTVFTSAPTPSVSSNSTEIATTAYVNTKFQVVSALPASPDPDTYYFIPES